MRAGDVSKKQERHFTEAVIGTQLLSDSLVWISENLDPEQVYGEDVYWYTFDEEPPPNDEPVLVSDGSTPVSAIRRHAHDGERDYQWAAYVGPHKDGPWLTFKPTHWTDMPPMPATQCS